MADPFSIAGSAVGVVSLGIKCCEDLVAFIGHVKGRENEVAQISSQMEDFATILEQLQTIVDTARQSAGSTASLVDTAMSACATALDRLKQKIPCSPSTVGGNSLARHVRGWKTKLAYPFRRDELLFMKDMIETFQQNLIVALQALELANQQHLSTQMSDGFAKLSMSSNNSANVILDDVEEVHSDIKKIGVAIEPVSVGMQAMILQMAELQASILRLEARAIETIPDAYNATTVFGDARELRRLNRRVDRLGPGIQEHPRNIPKLCQCRSTTQSQAVYRRYGGWIPPFSITRATTTDHQDDCPYAKFAEVRTNLQFRLSFCSMLLGKKFRLAVDVQQGSGMFSISPILQTSRVVPDNSPAFALIDEFHRSVFSDDVRVSHCIRALQELFDTGRATPYDRRNNGDNLLHFACMPNEFNSSVTDEALEQFCGGLIHYMGSHAFEPSYCENSAADMLSQLYNATFLKFLRFGIYPLKIKYISNRSRYISPHEVVNAIGDDSSTIDNIATAILAKSCRGLTSAIGGLEEAPFGDIDFETALIEATRSEWWQGCEIILQKATHLTPPFKHLIEDSLESNNLEILRFWFKKRRKFLSDTTNFVELVIPDSPIRSETASIADLCSNIAEVYSSKIHDTLRNLFIQELVQDRMLLRDILVEHLQEKPYVLRDDRVLDTEILFVDKSLRHIGSKLSFHQVLYTRRRLGVFYQVNDACMADHLWNAGFRDIETTDIPPQIPIPMISKAAEDHSCCSFPLAVGLCEWFVSKGSKLSDAFESHKGNITAAQIMAYQAGKWISAFCTGEYEQSKLETFMLHLLSYSESRTYDDNNCRSGCCSQVGIFVRAAFMENEFRFDCSFPPYTTNQNRRFLWTLVSWVAPLARTRRDTVSNFLRSITFDSLGLEYRCLNMYDILPDIMWRASIHERNLDRSYTTNEDLDDIIELSEEEEILQDTGDAENFLLGRLELLLVEFEDAYDKRGEDIVDFVMRYWSKRMLEELKIIAYQDHKDHHEARKHLGVVLETFDQEELFDIASTGLVGDIDVDELLSGVCCYSKSRKPLREFVPSVR
ncbi:hypothetical protein B0J11DRAFT_529337 [Dendryphion nanum]|uniref:Azaphilone pigments biosynthesis cluster protein L N-terminal domain-containing protein n=1 Tax=Dendryphion nanum TaxID=256645 RepID=A0A9P9DMT7_9PLEO|nr:hypothetical protein B0J11DRAFT_529337 [Dendryphion nanum]